MSDPKVTSKASLKADRMPFGRWVRLVGWRHAIAILFCVWAVFPAFYVITLAFSGGNTLTAACPPERTGLAALSCVFPSQFSWNNFQTLITSDQWPVLVWFRNTCLLYTSPSPRD